MVVGNMGALYLLNPIDGIKENNTSLLPMWTEIHVQPLEIGNIENTKVYWIKHPRKKWTVYDQDLTTAINEFIKIWENEAKEKLENI